MKKKSNAALVRKHKANYKKITTLQMRMSVLSGKIIDLKRKRDAYNEQMKKIDAENSRLEDQLEGK